MNKFIFILGIFAFHTTVWGQSSLYDFVKTNYKEGKYERIALITKNQLELENVKGNRLYWSLSLIARANLELSNLDNAKSIIKSIPTDSIKHEPTKYDVIMLEALIYKRSGAMAKADSIYTKWLGQIPEHNHLLLAVNFNNYANVRLYYGDVDDALKYYNLAMRHNERTNDSKKLYRENLHFRNLANIYLVLNDLYKAEYWLMKINVNTLTTEELISWKILNAKINIEKKNYNKSFEQLTQARDLSLKEKLNHYTEESVLLRIKINSLQDRNNFINIAIIICLCILFIIMGIITLSHRRKTYKFIHAHPEGYKEHVERIYF